MGHVLDNNNKEARAESQFAAMSRFLEQPNDVHFNSLVFRRSLDGILMRINGERKKSQNLDNLNELILITFLDFFPPF